MTIQKERKAAADEAAGRTLHLKLQILASEFSWDQEEYVENFEPRGRISD